MLRQRLLGLGLLAVIIGGFVLTVAMYSKWFTPFVPVSLRARTIGNQLIVPADVRMRGVLVGRVNTVTSNGQVATLHLQLDPSQVSHIPSNVIARILPETLFGEKYVQLVAPANPSSQHIEAGAVIPQDRSKTAIELQTVFTKLLPLLQSLQPQQLSLTLANLADALRGRGEALGKNLTLVDHYFARLNPHLPSIQYDLSALADVASSYADAAPDLLAQAHNFAVKAKTVTEKGGTYATFLRDSLGFTNEATALVSQSGNDMIRVAQTGKAITDTLAYYSPELTCLLNGLANLEPRLNSAFGPGPYLHITLEFTPQRKGYQPGVDAPKYNTITGPSCYGLPNNPQSTSYPSVYTSPPPPNATRDVVPSMSIGDVGSPLEQRLVAAIVAPALGEPSSQVPASLADLLLGPVLRGAVVGVS